ncbi:MAG: ATP-binding protein [Planctomycetota bacterium]
MTNLESSLRVPADQLRFICDPERLGFATTDDVEPLVEFVGQAEAAESLSYGLDHFAPGQNVFVRGSAGTGRITLVQRLLEDLQPERDRSADLVYVRNFSNGARPRLLQLRPCTGRRFVKKMDDWVSYASKDLAAAMRGDAFRQRTETLGQNFEKKIAAIRGPFEKELADNGLALFSVPAGDSMRTVLLPVLGGQPAPPERLQELREKGELSDEDLESIRKRVDAYGRQVQELGLKLEEAQLERQTAMQELVQQEIRDLLTAATHSIRREFTQPAVAEFLDACVEDLAERGVPPDDLEASFWRRYQAHLLHSCPTDQPPIVIESAPSEQNLVGTIERKILRGGEVVSDHLMIVGGSILQANGGYLVLEARDLLSEPGAWRALVRTLRSGLLEISPSAVSARMGAAGLQPEPIPVSLKVVLIGEPGAYYLLDQNDPDFRNLFKVLADFEDELPSSDQSIGDYARFLARLSRDEKTLPFAASGVAVLAEHGARIAGRNDRLTARFGRLTDLAREAAYLCKREEGAAVEGDHVRRAILRARRRADMPARRFRERIADGNVNVQVQGKAVGQVNGLAVLSTGQLTFGFPSRLTATVGAGTDGVINIEGEAALSGSIHTKGFHILGGLLRRLLPTDHPLAFSASIAFEQSYGGIDGDSASGAEMCCLLSALTGVPLRQDLAMTGAIDQVGNVQAIGAASEKIEGFFDCCLDQGLTGTQGCLLPKANLRNLVLRPDVVEACREGKFRVYAVSRIEEALELFTGVPAGSLDTETGRYPQGSILDRALERVAEFWKRASGSFADR